MLLLVAPLVAQADTAVLRNGQRIEVTGHERLGERVRLDVAGGSIFIAAEQLVRVEPQRHFPAPARPALGVPFSELIVEAALRHGLDPYLVASVIAVESNFDPRAVSRKNAQGLMQLMPATAAELDVADPFHPRQNIEGGSRYLAALLARYGHDARLALAAYNAGPERVAQYGGVPPFRETREYVTRVLAEWQRRRAQAARSPQLPSDNTTAGGG